MCVTIVAMDFTRKKMMKSKGRSQNSAILPVSRTKMEAKQFYDRVSRFYRYLTEASEQKYVGRALNRLSIQEGETVLEIGFGPGRSLKQIAKRVGQTGKAYGIDISLGMIKMTERRLSKDGLKERVDLCCGDAMSLPYRDDIFDAIFMSFTLELFDTSHIPKVLYEVKRVLKPGGRLGIISMSKEDGRSILVRLYEWIHMKWPKYVDCRPIYVELSLKYVGYEVKSREKAKLFGLPIEIIVAC